MLGTWPGCSPLIGLEEEELTSEDDLDDFEVAGTGKDTDEGLDDDGGSLLTSEARTSNCFINLASLLLSLLFSSCKAPTVFTSVTLVSLKCFRAAISALSTLFSLSTVCFSLLSSVSVWLSLCFSLWSSVRVWPSSSCLEKWSKMTWNV